MKIFKDDSGQVLVLTALSMTLLMGFVGMATDVGALFHDKRSQQTAVDAAAIAGETANRYGGDVQTAAKNAAIANGISSKVTVTDSYSSTVSSPTLYVHTPPADGPNQTSGFVEAILTVPRTTIFMSFFGLHNVNITTRAVAGLGGTSPYCVTVLNQSAPNAMDLQGSFNVSAPGCHIAIDSNDACALNFTGSGGSMTSGGVSVVGGDCGKSADSTPAPSTQSGYVNDPYQTLTWPNANNDGKGCDSTPMDWTTLDGTTGTTTGTTNTTTTTIGGSTSTASYNATTGLYTGPGANSAICFTQPITLDGTGPKGLKLGPGIYVFESGVQLYGDIQSGTSTDPGGTTLIVTGDYPGAKCKIAPGTFVNCGFYIPTSGVTFGSYSDPSSGLQAPNSGQTADFALVEPPPYAGAIVVQKGNATGNISGNIYAPDAPLYLQDSGGHPAGQLAFESDIVVDTFFDQTAAITITAPTTGGSNNAPRVVSLVE